MRAFEDGVPSIIRFAYLKMKPKIIFFDCDGTLIHNDLWGKLHGLIEIPAIQEEKWWKGYYSGSLSFKDWMEWLKSEYHRLGLTKEKFELVMNNYTYNQGVKETCKKLHELGIPLAIISSGSDYYVRRIAKELGIDTWRANTIMKFKPDGNFEDFEEDGEDPLVKVEQIKDICKSLSIDPTETIFVGDSDNDRAAFKLTKHGVLYNNHNPVLMKQAWQVIKEFPQVLNLLDITR